MGKNKTRGAVKKLPGREKREVRPLGEQKARPGKGWLSNGACVTSRCRWDRCVSAVSQRCSSLEHLFSFLLRTHRHSSRVPHTARTCRGQQRLLHPRRSDTEKNTAACRPPQLFAFPAAQLGVAVLVRYGISRCWYRLTAGWREQDRAEREHKAVLCRFRHQILKRCRTGR